MQGVLRSFDVRFRCRDLAVTDLRYLAVIAFAFGYLGLMFEGLDTCFLVLDSSYITFLLVPTRVELIGFGFEVFELFLDLAKLGFVLLAFDGLALDLQLFDLTVERVYLFRLGVHFQTQFGCGFIDQVDCLIRQEPVGDISGRKGHGRDDSVIFDTHFVVGLITLFQTTKDRDRCGLIRLIDHHFLESTLQGFIGFKIFLILIERSSTDRPQVTTCQCWFEDVRCVHRTGTLTGSDQGVYLINEQDDLTRSRNHFVDDAFESFLELTLVLSAGNQRTHIEGVDLFLL